MKTKLGLPVSISIIIGFLLIPLFSDAQDQDIKGLIRDQSTKEPLIGASIQLVDSNLIIGTITDFDGEFRLEGVPIGRIRLKCDYLGYVSYITSPFLLGTAKVPFLEIEMAEADIQLQEVIVVGRKEDSRTQNEMVLLSGRSFVAEETERYAGSIADPSRMVVSFPGVQASNDLDNDIVVRGNSSVGVLWRLEGIDIPNPNHFARRGSSGGGISIFSVNMLRNSDFIYGSMPAEYGNTLSSVFDMKFRKGNLDNHEYSIRAGLLGLDLVGEGPIREKKSSYLFNYRYSTLGLLNEMGVHVVDKNTDNNFTDLSYHLSFTSNDNKDIIQVWGIGGKSSEIHHPLENPQDRIEFEDKVFTDFSTRMGVTGMNWTRIFDNNSFIKLKLAIMGDHITHAKDTVNSEFVNGFLLDERYTTTRITAAADYSKKVNNFLIIKTGGSATRQGFDLQFNEYDRYLNSLSKFIDKDDNNMEVHMYLEASAKPMKKIQLTGGIHFHHNSINDKSSIEPRLAAEYNINSSSTITFAYGLYSQTIPLGTYYTNPQNINLPLMKSHHWASAYKKRFGSGLTFNIEGYYQMLSNIPVASDPSIHYWMLNDLVGYSEFKLVGEGKGKNYGVDLSLDKSFDDGYFVLGSISAYRSLYSLDGQSYYSTRYDGVFNTSVVAGKEFYFQNGDMLQLGFKNLWYGGQWYAPDNPEITQSLNEYYDDYSQPLTLQNNSFWRSDLRISYRHNLNSRSWSLTLDIQNVLNRKNTRGKIWNINTQNYEDKLQAGIIPVISFQLDL